jgi:hypothetical protein
LSSARHADGRRAKRRNEDESMDANANTKTMKAVFTVVERAPGKSYWTRIGVGFVNRDGSLNLRLDALPINGTLQVRDWEPMDRSAGDAQGAPPQGPSVRKRDGSSAIAAPPNGELGALG